MGTFLSELVTMAAEFFKEADKLYEDSEDVEIVWRLARVVFEQYKTGGKSDNSILYKSYELIQKALKITDENFHVHKWYVVILDSVGEVEGNKVRITNSYVCKEHLEKALSMNQTDGIVYHSLGVWCFLFADMNWVTRKIASAIFASPPTSTYLEALDNFLKAEEVEPGFYTQNLVMIGTIYIKLGNKEAAIPYLKKAKDSKITMEDDKDSIKEATKLLKSIGVK